MNQREYIPLAHYVLQQLRDELGGPAHAYYIDVPTKRDGICFEVGFNAVGLRRVNTKIHLLGKPRDLETRFHDHWSVTEYTGQCNPFSGYPLTPGTILSVIKYRTHGGSHYGIWGALIRRTLYTRLQCLRALAESEHTRTETCQRCPKLFDCLSGSLKTSFDACFTPVAS